MAEDIRRTHVMLFMIPPEVMSRVGVIKEWMAERKGKGRKRRESVRDGDVGEKGGLVEKEKVEIMVSAVEMV